VPSKSNRPDVQINAREHTVLTRTQPNFMIEQQCLWVVLATDSQVSQCVRGICGVCFHGGGKLSAQAEVWGTK
jgi:hypothetical protein